MIPFGIKFMKQALMRKVLLSLIPIQIAAIYFFGWRVLVLAMVITAAAILTEWAFKRKSGKPVTEAVIVSAVLYTLTLPPGVPYWIAIVGIVFGIVFAKEAFGGFGRNVFNPALVARAFVYVCFPVQLTVEWISSVSRFDGPLAWLGGFSVYSAPQVESVTTATPMLAFRSTGDLPSFFQLFIGTVNGSIGETSALLILLAAFYLIYTKTAAWETMAGVAGGYVLVSFVFNQMGIASVLPVLEGLVSGGLLFGMVFMATDPISSPKTFEGRIAYGFLIGITTVIIRSFALFAGGVMFAILIGNTFAPLIDEIVKTIKTSRSKPESQTEVGGVYK